PSRQIWVWGAGHVGRALVGVLGQLPDLAITWVDTAPNRFPPEEDPQSQVSGQVTRLVAQDLCLAATHAPANAEHYILTYSHEFDLGLCHQLLSQPARHIGLIGSATKWARFKTRLSALGHPPLDLARIQCPIGDPSLGKHPQAIALGVASDILRASQRSALSQQEQSL
ncbi:MAG: XdhC family protein, partial [Mangrovicoccus sp.]